MTGAAGDRAIARGKSTRSFWFEAIGLKSMGLGLSAVVVAGAASGPSTAVAAQRQSQKPAQFTAPATADQGPFIVVVSIGDQRLAVYDKRGRVLESGVSSGQRGYETPQGVFAIIERNREHFSNLYNDAPMPNMQRITWSGVALHAGNLPGYPASHGCIRLPHAVSSRLFELTRLGTRVVVTQNAVAPLAIEHPVLFKVRSAESPVAMAMAQEPHQRSRTDAILPAPMTFGGAVDPVPQGSGLPPVSEAVAARPIELSKAAWAAQLAARAQPLEVAAKAAKAKQLAADKDAERLMAHVLMLERTRSALAAKVDALEQVIARGGPQSRIVRAEQIKAAHEVRLIELLAETDRARSAHEETQAVADLAAREAAETGLVRDAAVTLTRDAYRNMKPVSVFISRETGRLYARQGFQPLFDVAIDIDQATAPIGTHVYTALEQKSGSDAMAWSAVTTSGTIAQATTAGKKPRAQLTTASIDPQQSAASALDRIKIPDDVRQRIGDLLVPGSSLIISDHGVSAETGKGTDFVILTK